MRCPNCGSEADGAICPLCGASIAAAADSFAGDQTMQNETDGGFKMVENDNTSDGGFKLAGNDNVNPSGSYEQPVQNTNPYGAPMMNEYSDLESNPYDMSSMGNGSSQTPRKKSSGGIIGVIVAIVVVAAALLWFFLFREDGVKKSKEIVDVFMTAIEEGDTDKIASVVDPECVEDEEIEALSSAFAMLKTLGVDYTMDYEITKTEKTSDGMIKSMCGSIYGDAGVAKKIKSAYTLSVTYTMDMSYMGESESQSDSMELVCYKKDGKWYIGGYMQ